MNTAANPDLQNTPDYEEVPMEARVAYFLHFVRGKHREHMDFILHTAKLRIKHNPETWAGWNNVMKHNAAQSVAIQTLCKHLHLPQQESGRLESYAFLHNPTICRDKYRSKMARGKSVPQAEQFTPNEEKKLDDQFAGYMNEIDADARLQLATSPEFFDAIAKQEGAGIEEKSDAMEFSDLLVYYVDALFEDGNLLSPHERIALMEKRRPDLNEDEARTARLGMKYWDAERAVSARIQTRVWELLAQNGIALSSADEVPEFLRNSIGQEMIQYWHKTHGA